MSSLLNRFRTLQWRFAASYMLVTVLTVALLPAIYFTASYIFVVRSPDLPRDMAAALEGVAPQTLPYVVQPSLDRSGLQRWLADFNSNGRLQGQGSFADLWMSGPPYGTSTLTVVDPDGLVIASSTDSVGLPGTLLAARLAPDGQRVLEAALSGDTRPSDLATPIANGRAEVAVPITVPGHVVGALVLSLDVQATQDSFIPRAAAGLMGFVVILSLGSGLIGLVFGFIISRGLVRRLRSITQAARAWSRGDFDVTAHDTSGDELGRLARDLDRMAQELHTLLATRQELAIVEERNRLARDLHDSVKQQVFAASMQVAAARALVRRDPDAAEARLSDVERMVGEAQRELTGLIQELRPVALENKGLVPALREYGSDWSRRTGIAVEIRAQGERAAPLDVEQALFRVAQEALANVAKHSGATSAEVRASWEPDALKLTVTDNGRGFDVSAATGKGVGLQSMRERVEAIGGALSISRALDGQGMCVEACVPSGAISMPATGEAATPVQNATQALSAQRED